MLWVLRPDHAVGDVDAEFLELAGELDIGGLVEARLQLDHHGDLLAVARGVAQVADDLGVARGAVQRHLDGADLRIVAGFAQEALDRSRERFVGMQQQERAGIADDVEDTAADGQARMVDRMMRRIVQRGRVESTQVPSGRASGACRRLRTRRRVRRGRVRRRASRDEPDPSGEHFEPHDRREAAVAQLGFDQREQVVGLFLVALGVGVAGDAEKFAGVDRACRGRADRGCGP